MNNKLKEAFISLNASFFAGLREINSFIKGNFRVLFEVVSIKCF